MSLQRTLAIVSNYSFSEPTSSVAPLPQGFAWRRDLVDYARHPAYAPFVQGAGITDRLGALASYAGHFAVLLAKRAIRYEMIPTELRQGRGLAKRAALARTALTNAFSGTPARGNAGKVNEAAERMDASGIAVAVMPKPRLAAIEALSAAHFDRLRVRRGDRAAGRAFDESRAQADRDSDAALYALIEQTFAEAGIMAAASAYLGRPARLVDVNPQINDASDSFWRDIFDGKAADQLPRTAYCHRDASGGDLKAIIYMTDVGPANGPFAYAVGSHRMAISPIDNLLCEANDHNGLSATDAATRRRFAALPAALRQKGAFGNDLDDSAPEADAIARSLWSVTGDAGSIVLFDTKGIHRGGMVEQGERRVLTCVIG
jgi:hypothetical protein